MSLRAGLVGMALLALFSAPAHAMIIEHLEYDTDIDAAVSSIVYVAEGRIGDRGGHATFELDAGPSTASPAATAQFNWQNNSPVGFSLTYTPLSQLFTFSVADTVLLYNAAESITDIFIRTRAVNDNSGITIGSLSLNGQIINDISQAEGSSDGLDIVRISGINLSNGFSLSGMSTMWWSLDSIPTQSRLAYQVKLGYDNTYIPFTPPTAIPEPGTFVLIGLGSVIALCKRTR